MSLLSLSFSFLQGGRPLTDVSYAVIIFFLFSANLGIPHPSSSPFALPQGREGGRGLLSIMAYTGKGIPFSVFRYMKG